MTRKGQWSEEQARIGTLGAGRMLWFACHWEHQGKTCGGHNLLRKWKGEGRDYMLKCSEGIVYVGRIR